MRESLPVRRLQLSRKTERDPLVVAWQDKKVGSKFPSK
jgi:hypothetical protein